MLFSNFAKKRIPASWLIQVFILLLLSSCSPGSVQNVPHNTPVLEQTYSGLPGTRPFIDSRNGIHLFQSFDYKIDDPAAIAKYYDFVWGASPNDVAAFRSGNPHIFLSYYFSFFRDSGTFSNQDATHTLAYWQKVHPDWILYQCDRKTPAYEDSLSNVPFNFANPAVISWEVNTYALPASENGYDAIAADNVNMQNLIHACGYYKNGQWVQRYSGEVVDPQWQHDVATWTIMMQQALRHLPHPLALIPNLGLGISMDNAALEQVVSHVDAILDEGGFTNYANGYLTGSAWVQTVNFIKSMQQAHKAFYIVNQFPEIGRSEIEWALASYLMCKEHAAAVAITPKQGYGVDLRYPEYQANIGSPLDEMKQEQNIEWRTYSHGLSLVNPSPDHTYSVTLPKGEHFVDLYGNTMAQTVTLPPHSGLILLTVA